MNQPFAGRRPLAAHPALHVTGWTVAGLLTAAGAALAGYAALGSLTWPAGRDQGVFEWIGQVILEGGVPYRDAWDQKGPLLYYVYALALGLSGRHEAGIRVLDLGAVLAGAWLLHGLTRRLSGERFGADLAVIFMVLAYFGGGFWNTAQPDGWGGLLILTCVVLLLKGRKELTDAKDPNDPKLLTAMGCGAGIALATLLKPTFLIDLALPVLHLLGEPERRRQGGVRLGACLAAFGLVIAAGLGLLQWQGGLAAYWDVLRFTATSYGAGSRHLLTELAGQPYTLLRNGLLVPCLLAPYGLWRLKENPEARLLAAWWGLALLTVLIQGKYWLYQWTPGVIAVAPLLGVALAPCGERLGQAGTAPAPEASQPSPSQASRAPLATALALLISVAAVAPAAARAVFHAHDWPLYALRLESWKQYVVRFSNPDGTWTLPPFERLADDIAQHSTPGDTVLMWGWDLQVNLLSHRKPPSRFGFAFPLVMPGPMEAAYRRQLLADIQARPPRYVVVCPACQVGFGRGTWSEGLEGFPQLKAWLHARYDRAEDVGAYQLWGLRGATAPPP